MKRPQITRRTMLRAALRMSAAMALGGGSGLAYATQVEPRWLATERVRIALPNLPPAFEGYRLAQISDLHMGESVPLGLIRAGVKRALELAPDVVVLTGDYVTAWLDGPALVAELARLAAPDGVWAVLGNHDHWVDPSGVRSALAEAGVRELRNAHTVIERDGERLILAGVDDIWERQHDLDAALEGVPDGSAAVLLAHEPDYADQVYPGGRVGLQLSGHSHGGQVRLPLIDAPVLPYLAHKYPYGLRRLGGMWLYTNRGLGHLWRVRVNCRPEVTEITLIRL